MVNEVTTEINAEIESKGNRQNRNNNIDRLQFVCDLKQARGYLDSGATAHMGGSRNLFINYVSQSEDVVLADNNFTVQ